MMERHLTISLKNRQGVYVSLRFKPTEKEYLRFAQGLVRMKDMSGVKGIVNYFALEKAYWYGMP
jgi:hypothetical protein